MAVGPAGHVAAGGAREALGQRARDLLVGKRVLAPLTTVGNLPFRRLCVQLGAEVTWSEMAMAHELIAGNRGELALLRRHESEKIFGVQIAGSWPEIMAKCGEMLEGMDGVDMVDINMACPLQGLHDKGMGSALMLRQGRVETVIRSMRSLLTKPLTIKMRIAHMDNRKVEARTMCPKLASYGVDGITLHGRTAPQRYTKLADWGYIGEVKQALLQALSTVTLIGCGDVLSWEECVQRYDQAEVDGVMIGRGALYKPWIFTEIKERRVWDISATERLGLLQDFTRFGLEHWGADGTGVEKTRLFLLEQLSFLYRYIPVGLLEVLPQKMNWRPPPCFGRNDLETKMLSPNVKDWVEITEMLLGKVPEGFVFMPKHKSNAWAEPTEGAG